MLNLDDMSIEELKLMISNDALTEEKVKYARYAILAQESRLSGAMDAANYYTRQCDRIYAQLPEDEKW